MTKEEITEITKHIEIHARREPRAIYITEILRKAVLELVLLQEENAELRSLKDVATLIRANNDTVVTLMQLNNKLVSKSQQLTKAKELLNEFVHHYKAKTIYIENMQDLLEQVEQFLKDSEVEK